MIFKANSFLMQLVKCLVLGLCLSLVTYLGLWFGLTIVVGLGIGLLAILGLCVFIILGLSVGVKIYDT